MDRKLKIGDLQEIIAQLYPPGSAIEEDRLASVCGVSLEKIRIFLDRLLQHGFLRMDGFKYFRS
jgi:DNA-binding GntR family transcriptional regulator